MAWCVQRPTRSVCLKLKREKLGMNDKNDNSRSGRSYVLKRLRSQDVVFVFEERPLNDSVNTIRK